MFRRSHTSLMFLLTGFGWLALSLILGLAMLLGMIRGTPLPLWVREIHVHAALVGGVMQTLLGGFLVFMNTSAGTVAKQQDAPPLTFWGLNVGVIGMLVGFWLYQPIVIGGAGFIVLGSGLVIAHAIWVRAGQMGTRTLKQSWYYGLALLGLVSGAFCGELLTFGVMSQSQGALRLAHIHLIGLGFVVLTLMGVMHQILPSILQRPLISSTAAHNAMILMAIGTTLLIGGFLNASVPIELAAGAILLAGTLVATGHLFQTWNRSAQKNNAAADHLLIGTVFLLFTIILGMLLALNVLSGAPVLPYGMLHMMAYTHMAFVGFVINVVMGTFSYLLPTALATTRVTNNKKRVVYLDQLNRVMHRWQPVQISTLGLGTMGLGILAALTWNMPMSSIYVHVAMWTCLGLFVISLVLFSIKLTLLLSKQPEEITHTQAIPDDLAA